MKLTVPAVRVAETDPARREASEHTVFLLETIDALLAETMALTMAMTGPPSPAGCSRPGHHGERGPGRPISPAA